MKFAIDRKVLIALILLANAALFFVFVKINEMRLASLTASSETSVDYLNFPKTNASIENLNTISKAFIIYEPDSRTVIASKNDKLRFAPASTAKIMTSTIVLEEYDIDQMLSADGVNAVVGSEMGLFEGEDITVENLLYGLMLPSGNDAAYVLANNYQGGVQGFVSRMNEKAAELNLSSTKFYDPAGLLDENYTTAFDMARLAAYAIQNKKFTEIVSTKSTVVHDVTGQIVHELDNLNELLGQNGVTGIKTGFTDEAQGVLVTSIEKEGKTYIIVVLNTPDRFGDTYSLIMNAIRNLEIISY